MKIHPDSSMIESYDWDDESHELTAKFKKGGVYSYPGVPEHVFQEMQGASSVGRYFLANIKGQY